MLTIRRKAEFATTLLSFSLALTSMAVLALTEALQIASRSESAAVHAIKPLSVIRRLMEPTSALKVVLRSVCSGRTVVMLNSVASCLVREAQATWQVLGGRLIYARGVRSTGRVLGASWLESPECQSKAGSRPRGLRSCAPNADTVPGDATQDNTPLRSSPRQ